MWWTHRSPSGVQRAIAIIRLSECAHATVDQLQEVQISVVVVHERQRPRLGGRVGMRGGSYVVCIAIKHAEVNG